MNIWKMTALATFVTFSGGVASASDLEETAISCLQTLDAGDIDKFQARALEIRGWRNVWDTKALISATKCLTSGYGMKWEYSTVQGRFVSETEDAEILKDAAINKWRAAQAQRDAAALSAELKHRIEARRAELEEEYKKNSALVGSLAYETCAELLTTDKVRALTNQVCLDKFTQFGLPKTE